MSERSPALPEGAAASHIEAHSRSVSELLAGQDWSGIMALADDLLDCWKTGRQVFLVGNGGSAGTAIHLANDLLYPISKRKGSGLRVQALVANQATLTCLANDEGYDEIFAYQLATLARAGDLLIALSGSGNSPNVVKALVEARLLGLKSYALVGFNGGKARELADVCVHFRTTDMQVAEDAQLIAGHMLVKCLSSQKDNI